MIMSSSPISSKDYEFTTSGGHNFVLNVCKGVNQEVWNIENPDTVGAFVRRDHGDFSIGCVSLNAT